MKSEWLPDDLSRDKSHKENVSFIYAELLETRKKHKERLKDIAAAFAEYEKERKSYERKQYCQQTDDLEKQEQLAFAWRAKQRLLNLFEYNEEDEPIS